jgi:tRNA(Ile)-lysidine synthase
LPAAPAGTGAAQPAPEYTVAIPGEVAAPAFGLRLQIERIDTDEIKDRLPSAAIATLRNWRPGDRVRLRYSSAPHKVKEVLERLKVTGSSRALWPVLEIDGRIVWMQGADVEPELGIRILSASLEASAEHS